MYRGQKSKNVFKLAWVIVILLGYNAELSQNFTASVVKHIQTSDLYPNNNGITRTIPFKRIGLYQL